MAVSTILKHQEFRGAEGNRNISLGTGTTVTPPKDGWLRVSFTTQTGQSIAPVVSVTQNDQVVGYGSGLGNAGTTASMFFPVKAGLTYKLTAYRATIASEVLFY